MGGRLRPMSDPALQTVPLDLVDDPPPAPASRARGALLKRLADTVCLPGSRINAFERSITADLLVEMLREASAHERARAARRLSSLVEIPSGLVRLLLRDEIDVARALIE